MTLPRHPTKRGRVEIIPLIDTILILLIFYMSFSSFREKENPLEVPLPARGDGPPPLEIAIHVRGTDLLVNGIAYDPTTLRAMLTTVRETDARTAVVISADPDTRYQAVIRAVDACAQAKLRKVAFRPLNG